VQAADDALNLSGVWQGFFNYPIAKAPVSFSAELTDADGALTGTTEEIGDTGDAAGKRISATLQGRRAGHAVTWLKIYDLDYLQYDSVRYEGTISADGLEIEGRWTVPGNWSGTFLMIRAGGTPATADAGVKETA
jgi:hypothetical protein